MAAVPPYTPKATATVGHSIPVCRRSETSTAEANDPANTASNGALQRSPRRVESNVAVNSNVAVDSAGVAVRLTEAGGGLIGTTLQFSLRRTWETGKLGHLDKLDNLDDIDNNGYPLK